MVASMIDRDPLKRHTVEQYLEEQTGKAFPSCFYAFLLPYVHKILKEFSPDFVIYKYEKKFHFEIYFFLFLSLDFIEIFLI
jgi:hypothetical protein